MRRLMVLAGALSFALSVFAQPTALPSMTRDEISQQQSQQKERQQQQPYNNAPVWKAARGAVEGYTSLPAPEAGVLIQTDGQNWRALRNGTVSVWGGWALVAMMLVVGIFYAVRGTIQLHEAPTGRMMDRFSLLERMAHWSTAVSFCVLAVSGLILAFGKSILIPVLGFTLFSWLAFIAKNLHNFLGPLFALSCVITFVVFVRDNIPKAIDLKWIASAGGLFNDKHVPSEKFNAGEKVWFWGGVTLLGIVVSASGFVLDFPNFGQSRATMQFANIVHLIGATLFMVAALGHIYMGTLGVAGALDAMKTGRVDETWAKEHHEIWYEQAKAAPPKNTTNNVGKTPVAVGGDD
ncbi:MAG TPA: formate dehydrogenase subunit gamma [Casimicrobium sp.]|nr:formate dehydrogenase subunit gamma [Casimicrobium sp.]